MEAYTKQTSAGLLTITVSYQGSPAFEANLAGVDLGDYSFRNVEANDKGLVKAFAPIRRTGTPAFGMTADDMARIDAIVSEVVTAARTAAANTPAARRKKLLQDVLSYDEELYRAERRMIERGTVTSDHSKLKQGLAAAQSALAEFDEAHPEIAAEHAAGHQKRNAELAASAQWN